MSLKVPPVAVPVLCTGPASFAPSALTTGGVTIIVVKALAITASIKLITKLFPSKLACAEYVSV